MAAVDDLFERADALPEPLEKTREELVRDLERWIRHAEDMARTMPKEAAYRIALSLVEDTRARLEAFDANSPEDCSRSRDASWGAFLAEHPELVDEPTPEPPAFTDDELVAAVGTAVAKWDEYLLRIPNRGRDGCANASHVSSVLAPNVPVCVKAGDGKNRPSGWQLIVAARLRRVADEGRVVRLRHKCGGANAYSLPGIELGEWPLKHMRLDRAR